MAKKRLKNDQLAKLRQFQKGMDVEDYLQNQHRQVIRALEESYVVGDDLTPYATNDSLNSAVNSINSSISSIQSTLPVVSGVHALFDGRQFTTGNVVFNNWYCPSSAGTFNGTVFRPSKAGVYWIEIMFRLNGTTSPTYPSFQIDVDIIKETSSILNTYTFVENPYNESFNVSRRDADDSWTNNGPVPSLYKHLQAFTTLTPTQGAFIKFSINYPTGSLYKMMCKIYRIGD